VVPRPWAYCKYYQLIRSPSVITTNWPVDTGKSRPQGLPRTPGRSPRRAIVGGVDQWWTAHAEPDGLILRDRVLSSGVDPDQLVTALRTGRLFRVQRGVYGARASQPGPLARARAAALSSGVSDAVVSHTAARVHGLSVPTRPAAEHVTVRRDQRRIRRRDLHFHGRTLALGDVQVHGGVALTSVARTVFDLCVPTSPGGRVVRRRRATARPRDRRGPHARGQAAAGWTRRRRRGDPDCGGGRARGVDLGDGRMPAANRSLGSMAATPS